MLREFVGCRTPLDHLAWSQRWAEELSGRAAQQRIAAMTPVRPDRPARISAGRASFG
jgi:hypothetical protein